MAVPAAVEKTSGGSKLGKRPEKPDRSQLDAQINTLREQISKCHDKMGALKTKIDGIKEGRKGQGSATAAPRNKLIELRTELKGLYVSGNRTTFNRSPPPSGDLCPRRVAFLRGGRTAD